MVVGDFKDGTKMKTSNRYLPLDDWHVAPIFGLSPEDLKQSAKFARKFYQNINKPIKHTTLLSAITKKLGFHGGFAGYQKEYETKLLPFFEKHNLKRLTSFFPLFSSETNYSLVEVQRDQLTDPINLDPLLPYKINPIINQENQIGSKGLKYNEESSGISKESSGMVHLISVSRREIADRLLVKNQYNYLDQTIEMVLPHVLVFEDWDFFNYNTLDRFESCVNMIGDLLIRPRPSHPKVISKRYFQYNHKEDMEVWDKENREYYFHRYLQFIEEYDPRCFENILKEVHLSQEIDSAIQTALKGWLKIIPYNEHLIFLKDNQGNYDFLFKNIRDHKPPTISELNKVLTRIPEYYKEYIEFKMTYYFKEVWQELEIHQAEEFYYQNKGTQNDYPGLFSILYDYSKHKQLKATSKNNKKFNKIFSKVSIFDKDLHISELINISDFEYFLNDSGYYESKEKWTKFKQDNPDEDKSLPVSVSWMDALAYLAWFETKTKMKLRLIKPEEYLYIYKENDIGNIEQSSNFIKTEKMDPNRFTFPDNLIWKEFKGIYFLIYEYFAEWTSFHKDFESAFAINSKILSSGRSKVFPEQRYDNFAAMMTGTYKGMKIGFRMVSEEK